MRYHGARENRRRDRIHPLLHGCSMARGARRNPALRAGARYHPGRLKARHGSLRDPWRTRPRRGRPPQGSGRHRLQPQPRHLTRALPEHRHLPHLRRSPAHDCKRPEGRHVRLLRRHPRPRGNHHGPPPHARGHLEFRSPAGVRADQLPHAHARHPARGKPAGRYL